MNMNKIKFISNMPNLNENSISYPTPANKNMPKWYLDADKFYKNDISNRLDIKNSGARIPTWKACPGLFDMFSAGYIFKTPCDLTFFINEKKEIDVRVEDPMYRGFCLRRDPLSQFTPPLGYYQFSFAWFSPWGIETPNGYSCIYMNPANRYDLPFLNTEGIIDTDKVSSPGSLPFYVLRGWTGTIPAGTPYLQILPFKREDWKMELKNHSYQEILKRHQDQAALYRTKDGGQYKKFTWTRKKYE